MGDVKLPTRILGTHWYVDACLFESTNRLQIEPFWISECDALTFGLQIEVLGRGFNLSIINNPRGK